MGKIPVFRFPDGQNGKDHNPHNVDNVHDHYAHRDKPELMLPWAWENDKKHKDLVKLLQAGTTFNYCDKTSVAEPHKVGIFGGNAHAENIPVYPQTGQVNLPCQPIGCHIYCSERFDEIGKIPPEYMKSVSDHGKEYDIDYKTIGPVIVFTDLIIISSYHIR